MFHKRKNKNQLKESSMKKLCYSSKSLINLTLHPNFLEKHTRDSDSAINSNNYLRHLPGIRDVQPRRSKNLPPKKKNTHIVHEQIHIYT